jgi:hypothetical protein
LARAAWRVSGVMSALVLVCPAILVAWALTRPWPVFDVPTPLIVVFGCLLAASAIGITLPIFAMLAWRRSYWGLGTRMFFSGVALVGAGLGPWLHYWNLLGFRY